MTTPAALFGAMIGAGLLLLAVGWTTPAASRAERAARPRRASRWSALAPATRRMLLAGFAGGLVGWLVTGWFALMVLVPAAVVGIPALLRPPRAGTPIATLEALEEWTRGLAGVLTVGSGLEQALITSARSAPDQIRPQVAAMAARLHARTDTATALRAFADDLNDATADLIVLSLTLAASKRGMGLAPALTSLARSVAKDVANRRAVEAERAKLRTTTRTITALTLIVMGGLFITGDYVAPYRTGVGTLVLTGLIAAYIGTLAWLRALGTAPVPPRLIVERAA